ncbi:hypothetical protein B9Z55_019174 [Caenorhabditis nigoni]|uniref:Uncharacterized protein n=1 Tax=Caenorhabditis nigoni TaxID=1611254 RepID=A0A2G5THB7_9PELO|nr:hypothetical protein B9Z55_019174 [Caenorhabditis nigoni]
MLLIVFGLIFLCFIVDIFEYFWLFYQRRRAVKEMVDFERMMEHVAGGSFVGMPLSPNEQVLRAVCYCDKATFAHHRLRRVDPLMPIRFSTGNDEEIPAVADEGGTVEENSS